MTNVDLIILFLVEFFYDIIVYKLIQDIKFKNNIIDRRLKLIESSINNLVFKFCNLMFQNIINALSSIFIKEFTVLIIELRDLLAVDSILMFKNKNVSREY